MSRASWINLLVLGFNLLLGLGIMALAMYMQYRRRMHWSIKKTNIQTIFGEATREIRMRVRKSTS